MSNPLRIGVVGVGFGAAVHIPAFQSEGLEVAAVCSRRRERAEAAADRFGVEDVYIDYDEMLDEAGLDAVSIVTPAALHHSMTLAALAKGKHVICEKPFALDAAQAAEMHRLAEARGVTAMVAHEFRFAAARVRVKELLDEGYIGRPRLALMRVVLGGFGRPGQPAASGPQPYVADRDSARHGAGFLFGLGSHYIDGLRHWLGDVESVSGEVTNFSPERLRGAETVLADADDTFLCHLRFRNGALAQVIGTRAAPFGSGQAIELYGSEGALVLPQRGVNPPAHGEVLGARLGEERLQELALPERLVQLSDDRDERLAPFRLLTREFLRGIESGTSPAPSFLDGLRCQQVMDAVRESAATGRRVDLTL